MKIKFWEKKPCRLTLKGWAAMEDLEREIDLAAKEGNWSAIPDLIYKIIELDLKKVDKTLTWMDSVKIFHKILELNSPAKDFPMLHSREKGKPMPWEYQGRAWYFWLHLFAQAYGWSEKEVAKMNIDDAVGLYQEIIIEDQLNKEWDWGLSEISYEYNKTTKKSHFKPLPRPDWMRGIVGKPKPVKTVRVAKSALPVGEVINLDEQKQG